MNKSIAITIEYPNGVAETNAPANTILSDAVRQSGLVLNTRCGGHGSCGGCAVDLISGTYRNSNANSFAIDGDKPKRVLACKTLIEEGPIRISIPRRSLIETENGNGETGKVKILANFLNHDFCPLKPSLQKITLSVTEASLEDPRCYYEKISEILLENHQITLAKPNLNVLEEITHIMRGNHRKVEVMLAWLDNSWQLIKANTLNEDSADNDEQCFGLALDIGTTTIAISLVETSKGKILDTLCSYNQQIQLGDDVNTRIANAGDPEKRRQLQKLIIDNTINPLIASLCSKHSIKADQIVRLVASGNTVMWHLLLGIDPTSLGAVPFELPCRRPAAIRAYELGIAIYSNAIVDIVPSISAYVGGDVVGDLAAADLHDKDKLSLLIDIGTNGEIAITDGEKMLVTACAAGPAFEGLRISHGMRASVGAIERVKLGDNGKQCEVHVIGNENPIGICGSGLIDFLAEGLRAGLITHTGRFNRDLINSNSKLRTSAASEHMLEYILTSNGSDDADNVNDAEVVITEKDIETLLQAKAAIFAAVNLMIKQMGKKISDLDHVILAGGFARYINIENAITIGLLPEIEIDKFMMLGNGSLAGAYLGLINRDIWNTFYQLSDKPKVVELNLNPEFQDEFTLALFLPNMEEELFPKTCASLNSKK